MLIEHPAVAEAAVVPAPDPVRLAVPKAYVVLAPGHEPTAETVRRSSSYAREHLAPYLRVRRLEFAELPKTISGKIRRVELRAREDDRPATARSTGVARRPVPRAQVLDRAIWPTPRPVGSRCQRRHAPASSRSTETQVLLRFSSPA